MQLAHVLLPVYGVLRPPAGEAAKVEVELLQLELVGEALLGVVVVEGAGAHPEVVRGVRGELERVPVVLQGAGHDLVVVGGGEDEGGGVDGHRVGGDDVDGGLPGAAADRVRGAAPVVAVR